MGGALLVFAARMVVVLLRVGETMYYNASRVYRSFALCVALFILAPCGGGFFVLYAQQTAVGEESSEETALSLSTDQSAIPIPSADGAFDDVRAPSSLWLFIRMILVLAIVIALIYAVLRFMRKTGGVGDTDDPFLRRVASLSLGQGKTVQVVTLLERAYLVGVTDNGINLIGEIGDKELVDSMNLFADKSTPSKKPRTFADVLELFMQESANRADARKQHTGSASFSTQSLREQRNRLNSGFGGDDE